MMLWEATLNYRCIVLESAGHRTVLFKEVGILPIGSDPKMLALWLAGKQIAIHKYR